MTQLFNMNTKEEAVRKILAFFRSNEKILLLTGTHQFKKHVLALSLILSNYPHPAKILFRVDNVTSAESFLSPLLNLPRSPRNRFPVNVQGGYELYVDSMNPRSWSSTPRDIDVAVVYPIDSLRYDEADDCIQDLMRRNVKKTFLISCTDNVDFGWVDQFTPVRVIYDAEEEDPDYHKRVLAVISQSMASSQIPTGKLPEYAKHIPNEYLIQILCRGKCGTGRWARLNKPYPGKTALKKAELGEYTATCLKCGYEGVDNYNWYR